MDYEEIKKLIDDMGNAKIDELEIEFPEGIKISMKKNAEKEIILKNIPDMKQQNFIPETTNMQLDNQSIINSDVKANINIDSIQEEKYKIIKSPMVGTFYSKPSPNKETFVKTGDIVKKGQVICIVEAMKLMNEIESEFDGEIAEICVKDGDIVEYGQPLFKIK
ncbi:MAG: acetyl-CoA carboxylase biotin carboxyl carrier protein [Clostridia bacterium]|nr:acetyl-CoA carboxylase biotin carboxyl carrier subunit [Clostridium sp. CAG:389]